MQNCQLWRLSHKNHWKIRELFVNFHFWPLWFVHNLRLETFFKLFTSRQPKYLECHQCSYYDVFLKRHSCKSFKIFFNLRCVFNIIYSNDVTNASGVTCFTGVKSDNWIKRDRKVLMLTLVTTLDAIGRRPRIIYRGELLL